MSLLPRTLTPGNVVDSEDASGEWPRLTLAELIDVEAAQFYHWRTDAGRMMGAELGRLAARVRRTGAQTPSDLYYRERQEEIWADERQRADANRDPSL